MAEHEQTPEPAAAEANAESPHPTKPTHSRFRAFVFMVVGLIVGAATAMAFPTLMDTYQIPEAIAKYELNPESVTEAKQKELDEANREALQQNSSLTYAVFGGIMGATFALLGTLVFRPSRAPIGIIAGLVLGGGAGALAGLGAVEASDYARVEQFTLMGLVIHGVAWSIVGIGVGLAYGLVVNGVRSIPGCILAGLLSGVLGALLFHPLAAVLSAANFDEVVPLEFPTRIVWAAVPAALFGLFLGGRPNPAPQPEPTTATPPAQEPAPQA